MRGIAAFVVVLHHCWESSLPDQNTFPFRPDAMALSEGIRTLATWVSLSPLRLLFAGHAAVGVFFVLSGFVLTRSLTPSLQSGYAGYALRRLFRIWVPFAVVIVGAALLVLAIAPRPIPAHPWINSSWNLPVTPTLLFEHLSMFGTPAAVSLDSPIWSLVHEMRISLVFPLLLAGIVWRPRAFVAGAVVLFALLSINHLTGLWAGYTGPDQLRGLLASVLQTLRYSLFFIFGILLSQHAAPVRALLGPRPAARALLWVVALGMLWLPYTAGYIEFAFATGAVLLLALCMSSPAVRTVLRQPALVWMGRRSYSLYLVHLLVLLGLMQLLYGRWPIYAILPLVVALSLILAEVTHRWVEVPANAIGKSLALRLARSRQPAGLTR